jgi:hypothetical protein
MGARFDDLVTFTDDDVEAAIRRNDPDELPLVPVTVALVSPDPTTAAAFCARLAVHDDPRVRRNAVAALGHHARRFRSLDEQRIKPIIESAPRDRNAEVRSNARSAADEIHQFLHWTIAGYVYG